MRKFVSMEQERFVDVILPLAIPNLYTYSVPASNSGHIKVGQRVIVQFGKKKIYTALVRTIHSNKPKEYTAKPIEGILDIDPIVNERQFELWKWISDYYMCTIGEVMNAALPSGLKLTSETRIVLNEENKEGKDNLTNDEFLIVEALEKAEILTMQEAEEIVQNKSVHSVVKSLLEKRTIIIYEELKEKFKPKIEEFVKLTSYASEEANLKKAFDELEKKAFKQLEILMEFVHLSSIQKEVKKSELLKRKDAAASVIDGLVKKNIFEVYERETGRFGPVDISAESKSLSDEQEKVLGEIRKEWNSKSVTLLHGVTSSGKTEVYVKLIEEAIQQGKQVLYLLPEIALTTQVVSRIKKYFGDTLGVYHSRFNENERVEIWNRVLAWKRPESKTKNNSSKFQVILGARSALFLPFSDLGLVIVDEEHDGSYKQHEPAPRYNAKDTALVLAHNHKSKVLLGSATPSIESYYNALNGKYGFVELEKRYGGVQMPEILTADIKDDQKRKKMKSHFSPLLMESVEKALNNKEQVILFQNRRGFAPHLECKTCGWVPQCKNCDVSLVYHKTGAQLRCHYCGYTTPTPASCNACGSPEILMKNFGTEKIEEELQMFFPDAKIARMDYDSTRSKLSYQRLINDFEEQNIDILVGTQMVTKGLDFENVSTVGILSADQAMNFPDFRSHERSFQLLLQVAGRAGRKSKRGKVIIQTYAPSHPILQYVLNNDFKKMYAEEIEHRKNFQYPPFFRIIELTVMDRDVHKVSAFADELGDQLKSVFGKRVLGPEFPLVSRIKNMYHKKLIIKIDKDESGTKTKEKINALVAELQTNQAFKYIRVQADVDPQ